MTARSEDVARVAAASMTCDHHWISAHQPDFPDAVYWIDRCSLCGTYNGERLSEQLAELLDSRERAIRWAVTLEGQLAEIEKSLHLDDDVPIDPPKVEGGYRLAYTNGWDDAVDHLRDLVRAALTGSTE